MSFGTYVAEQGDTWIDAIEKVAGPIEEFLVVADDPDERSRHIEVLQLKLRGAKFFLLVSAQQSIDVLLLPSALDERQLDDMRGLFERLELASELPLVTKLHALRPKPSAPPARDHNGPRLAAEIRVRLEPLRESADEYFILRAPERLAAQRTAMFRQLHDVHGSEASYQRLLAFPIRDKHTGKTRHVRRVNPRWRIPR